MISKPFAQHIGIVGGGQLGKMLIEAGLPWNLSYNVLDPSESAPSARYATNFIQAPLTEGEAIRQLAAISDIITYEIEHIDVDTLLELQKEGKKVIPDPAILKIIQDKSAQKEFYKEHGLNTAKFELFTTKEELLQLASDSELENLVVKSARGGYDGKGVWILKRGDVVSGNIPLNFDGSVYFTEEYLGHAREFSVIVARNSAGEIKSYPSVEMVFDPNLNLVDYLFAPSRIGEEEEIALRKLATDAIEAMNGIGLFAVEMFLTDEGEAFINEIAPRPHNSGHQTIEANVTSQYEQLNRILIDQPLGETDLYSPVVMMNLLGAPDVNGDYQLEDLNKMMDEPNAHLHWYNKAESRPGRKMGHLTVLAPTVQEAHDRANAIRSSIVMKNS